MSDKNSNSTKIYLMIALIAALAVVAWLYGPKALETQAPADMADIPPAMEQPIDAVNPGVAAPTAAPEPSVPPAPEPVEPPAPEAPEPPPAQ